jgi:hypothetical protein
MWNDNMKGIKRTSIDDVGLNYVTSTGLVIPKIYTFYIPDMTPYLLCGGHTTTLV